jgi:hypothetical protein
MTPQLVLDESTQHRLKTARASARSTENMQDWCIPASLQRMPQIGGPAHPPSHRAKYSPGESCLRLSYDRRSGQRQRAGELVWCPLPSRDPLKTYRGVRAVHLQLVVCSCITPLGKLLQV